MRKCILLPLLFSLFTSLTFSINIDSLQKAIDKMPDDTNKLKSIYESTFEIMRNHPKEAKKLIIVYDEIAKKLKYPKFIAYGYAISGNLEGELNNCDKALGYYLLELQVVRKNKMLQFYPSLLNNIGSMYARKEEFDKSMDYYNRALVEAEKNKDTMYIGSTLLNITTIYIIQDNYLKSKEFTEKASKYLLYQKEYFPLGVLYFNLGEITAKQHFLTEAKMLYKKSIEYRILANDSMGINIVYGRLGILLCKQKKYETGKKYFIKSTTYFKEKEHYYYLFAEYGDYGVAEYENSNFINSLILLDSALYFYKKVNVKDYSTLNQIYRALYNNYKKLNNHSKALYYYELHVQYKDSIDNGLTNKKLLSLQTQFETNEKENRIQLLTKDNLIQAANIASEKKSKFIILFSILVVSLIILLFYSRYRAKQKMKDEKNKNLMEQQKIVLEQKLLRSQMNPHFIFNSLDAIQSFIFLKKDKEAAIYLSKFGKLTRQILENSREEYILLEDELATLENFLALQQLLFEEKFNYTITVDKSIEQDVLMIPPMLAQPFIENALKHGIRHIEGKGQIEVNFYLRQEKLIFEVIDNGIGLQKAQIINKTDNKTHRSLATTITEERLLNINKNRKDKISILLTDIVNLQQEIIGVKLSFEIPYIYAC